MAESREIPVPPWYAAEVAAYTPEGLEEATRTVRGELDAGKTPAEIVDRLTESGHDRGFAEWYVRLAAATKDELRLSIPLAAYPRTDLDSGRARELRQAVTGYQFLLGAVGLLIVVAVACVLALAPSFAENSAFGDAFMVAYFGSGLLTLLGGTVAGKASGGPRWLSALAGLVLTAVIPCGSAVLLIFFLAKLHGFFRRSGIEVGLLGPDRESLRKAIQPGTTW